MTCTAHSELHDLIPGSYGGLDFALRKALYMLASRIDELDSVLSAKTTSDAETAPSPAFCPAALDIGNSADGMLTAPCMRPVGHPGPHVSYPSSSSPGAVVKWSTENAA